MDWLGRDWGDGLGEKTRPELRAGMRLETDRLWLVKEGKGEDEDSKWGQGVWGCNWMDGGAPRMGNVGVGVGLSVGRE